MRHYLFAKVGTNLADERQSLDRIVHSRTKAMELLLLSLLLLLLLLLFIIL
jgi:hypothetical protein